MTGTIALAIRIIDLNKLNCNHLQILGVTHLIQQPFEYRATKIIILDNLITEVDQSIYANVSYRRTCVFTYICSSSFVCIPMHVSQHPNLSDLYFPIIYLGRLKGLLYNKMDGRVCSGMGGILCLVNLHGYAQSLLTYSCLPGN